MRCLTLAQQLRQKGVECKFITRNHAGNCSDMIQRQGFETFLLPVSVSAYESAASPSPYHDWIGAPLEIDLDETVRIVKQVPKVSWLVVDHYGLDATWESGLRAHVERIFVIDDLANRRHSCDLLLDQTFGRCAKDYEKLVSVHTEMLCGADYALLRPEFSSMRAHSIENRLRRPARDILITLGGTDPDNLTARVLRALTSLATSKLRFTIVLGPTSQHFESVERLCHTFPFETRLYRGASNMAELMANSDIAIGAAGTTAWERCCLGIPSILMVIAQNQQSIASSLGSYGAAFVIQNLESLENELLPMVQVLMTNEKKRRKMIERAILVTDGRGVSRVIEKMGMAA